MNQIELITAWVDKKIKERVDLTKSPATTMSMRLKIAHQIVLLDELKIYLLTEQQDGNKNDIQPA